VPFLVFWVVALGLAAWREHRPDAKRRSLLILLFAALAAFEFALYFIGYERLPYTQTSPSLLHILTTCIKFLTMPFGPGVRFSWPVFCILLICVLGITIVVLVRTGWKQPDQRLRVSGFGCFLASMIALGLAIGLGRKEVESRYTASRWASVLLLGTAALVFWPNTRSGIQWGELLRSELGLFERQMKEGVPPYLLIHKFHIWLVPIPAAYFRRFSDAPRRAHRAFGFLKENPEFEELPVPFHPAGLQSADWREPTAYTSSPDASIEFRVPETPFVAGIRVRYTTRNADGTFPAFQLHWRNDQQPPYNYERWYSHSPVGDRIDWTRGSWVRRGDTETEMTVWVCDRVAGIRIEPDLKPCEFRISDLTLLLPKQGK
jgi:hypothetical protein